MPKSKETRTAQLAIRVYPSLKAALDRAAEAEMRSPSSMAQLIIARWLAEKGFLRQEND